MSNLIVRKAEEKDAELLKQLASKCPPLDIHTPYTYWVLCRFFNNSCFVIFDESEPIGFISSLDISEGVFVWQIGILENYRSKGYAAILINKVYEYATSKKADMIVTIDEANKRSYSAFKSFAKKNNLKFVAIDKLEIKDFENPDFFESEIIYKISK